SVTDTVLAIFGEVSEVTVNLYEDAQTLLAKQLQTLKKNMDDIDRAKYVKVVDNIGEILGRNKKYNAKQIGKVKKYLLERFD
ncbi:hypothetical protein FWH30_01430, partial [Microgenomates group bacterium]|nr:hypothetical protein [Microgenomates group bacterium]